MSRDKVAKSNALHESEQPLDLSKPHNDKNIIKQSLKSLIQTRRLAEGKGLLNVTFTHEEAAAHELTKEEQLRQSERKEQNRRAAHKCRQKKKHKLEYLTVEKDKLKKRKKWLEQTLISLEKEKDTLLQTLREDGNKEMTVIKSEPNTGIEGSNSSMMGKSCILQNSKSHICCECENQSHDPKNCNQNSPCQFKAKERLSCDKQTPNQTSLDNDDRLAFFNYYMKMKGNNDDCSNDKDSLLDSSQSNKYYSSIDEYDDYSDSDSSDSEGYLVIYESESDSDMFSNSQSS
ncbi:uncharacterized protein DDB_G0284459-like [Mytilus edulis]|uniref:BZIP domain-containing protein n=2 Tax=Mytilus TaxID=6548 RepID=A0A8B6DQ21_MYTGA|nr:unnamed protein product [Mytilus edulis]VDI22533.1 Hypothetical predicted protein [Mytilus galloprovincialis]